MRVAILILTAMVLGAGCVAQSGSLDPAAGDASPTGRGSPSSDGSTNVLRDEPQFCDEEDGCMFWDESYHEYVLYNVDTPVLDVLIVPSASANSASDTAVMKAAVEAWGAGVQDLGQSWFADGFVLNVYVLGQDSPPQSALTDPEIVVLAAEYNPFVLLGIGLEPKQTVCSVFGEQTLRAYPTHAHGGMEVQAADCTGLGFTCFAVNTNFLFGDDVWLYDLVSHEFGHCLGLGHVGDALDFRAKRVPVQDIMSYQHDDSQVHCVSTLNMRVLEALYAPLLGETVPTPLEAGDYYTMAKSAYSHVNCANP